MTEGEAVATAERVAGDAGYQLDDYEQASVTRDNWGWSVFYIQKSRGPVGGHFSVRIDATGAASIVPGR